MNSVNGRCGTERRQMRNTPKESETAAPAPSNGNGSGESRMSGPRPWYRGTAAGGAAAVATAATNAKCVKENQQVNHGRYPVWSPPRRVKMPRSGANRTRSNRT